MKVSDLTLYNFRGIEELSLSFPEQTTAFVGANGVGKSAVLEAVTIGLSQLIWRICSQPQKARPIAPDDIRQGAEFSRIEIRVEELVNEPVRWAVAANRRKGVHDDELRRSHLEDLNTAVKQLDALWEHAEIEQDEPFNLPLAVYYDVNRAALDIPMRIREHLNNSPHEVYRDALDHGGADFRRFFIWFRNREDHENEQRVDNPDYRNPSLEAVRRAVETFTQFTQLRIRRSPLRMTVQKNQQEFSVGQLSDGERNMLALVGDLARRLSVLNPGLANSNEGAGVVLIDEIDLHLHPRWQRDVVAKLEATFPHCQFIISTHSPQVIGELRPESVMLMRDGQLLGHAERSLGLSSAEVLDELMGTKGRNEAFQTAIDQTDLLMGEGLYDQARALLDSMSVQYGELPEILRLKESLYWFENGSDDDLKTAGADT
ncbi:MAG: AAA family ATPase [Burkholderiaceae bacterium]|jgi:predicted ATP-binding protein involved in virulence|nr:AAA family ATPase [Burkholderiaceae bacterium]